MALAGCYIFAVGVSLLNHWVYMWPPGTW